MHREGMVVEQLVHVQIQNPRKPVQHENDLLAAPSLSLLKLWMPIILG